MATEKQQRLQAELDETERLGLWGDLNTWESREDRDAADAISLARSTGIENEELLKKEEDAARAACRREFLERFSFDSRAHAAWFVNRYLSLKEELKRLKLTLKARCRTLEGKIAFREEMIPQLKAWAELQDRDTKKSIRMLEVSARLQWQTVKPAVEFVDDEKLVSSLFSALGVFAPVHEKLVIEEPKLGKRDDLRAWLAEHTEPMEDGTIVYTETGEVLEGIRWRKKEEKLGIRRVDYKTMEDGSHDD